MNTLHSADYEGVEIASSLELATEFAGPHLDALQLDMIWPHPRLLAEYRENHPLIKIVLQAGSNALAQVNNNPNLLASRLAAYGATIDYVLLDKSMGTGKGLDANFLQPFIAKIKNALPNLGIVIAGGLGPETMLLVQPLAAEFEDLSVDMQSGLRPTWNATHPIDIDRTERAVCVALEFLP